MQEEICVLSFNIAYVKISVPAYMSLPERQTDNKNGQVEVEKYRNTRIIIKSF